jgi:hypothetical protein
MVLRVFSATKIINKDERPEPGGRRISVRDEKRVKSEELTLIGVAWGKAML